MASFGENLKTLRKNKNLTQQELADKTHIKRSAIANYESGLREPNYKILIQIAEALDITVLDLLGTENKVYRKLQFPDADSISPIELDLIRLFRCAPKDIQNDIIKQLQQYEVIVYDDSEILVIGPNGEIEKY